MATKIFSNEAFGVYLDDSAGETEPALISVKLPERPVYMPGEILVAPGDVPALVKALVDAALAAYSGK